MRRRIVVVGYGMVGSRFLEELDRAVVSSGAESLDSAYDVTVLGEEPHHAYNRLLLSDVVAGRADLNRLTLAPAPTCTTVRCDTPAVAIDRERRKVIDSHGHSHEYDALVLATGARARIPDIPGVRVFGELTHGVRALRTLDDCRGILAAAQPARPVVVLGGGVLGIEVACGLRARGCAVHIVQAGPRLMAGQLDDEPAGALRESLEDLGITVTVDANVSEIEADPDDRLTGVRLGDGTLVPATMLVVAAGIEANVRIAEFAGLSVGIGVITDASQRSVDDPRVFAIGDCAQPPRGHRGLIASGWEHARRVAQYLAGPADPTRALGDAAPATDAALATDVAPAMDPGTVVRLKAVGLDVVSLGSIGDLERAQGRRVVRLTDDAACRSVAVAVRARRIEAAVCVGAPQTAALLTSMYERGTEVPDDPAYLLLDPLRAPAVDDQPSPVRIPDSATLCRCNGVTKKDVIESFRGGAQSLHEMSVATRATTGCGGCADTVAGVIEWLLEAEPPGPAGALTASSSHGERDVARR